MIITLPVSIFFILLATFIWIIGGHIIIGFIEEKFKSNLSLDKAIKIYLIWPFIPIITQIKSLLGYI